MDNRKDSPSVPVEGEETPSPVLPQKRKDLLSPRNAALFGGLVLLLILGVGLSVSYLHTLPGNEKWSFHTRGIITSTPAVMNGTLYVGTDPIYPDLDSVHMGMFYALDATTGNTKWSVEINGTNTSAPTVVNGIVYVSTDHSSAGFDQGMLYAFNAASGHQKWSYPIGEGFKSFSPTVVNGMVYVYSQHNSLDALDAISGRQKWSFPLGSHSDVHSSPTVVEGMVYAGVSEIAPASSLTTGILYVLDALTGSKKWSFATESEIDISPLVSGGMAYVPSLHSIHALDATTGHLKWTYLAEGKIPFSPVMSNGVMYVNDSFLGLGVSTLYAFDAATGKQKWFRQATVGVSPLATTDTDWISQLVATGAEWSEPAVVNGVVYATSNSDSINDHLYAFDAVSGRQKWSHQVEGPTLSALTVARGTMYMISLNGGIFAFDMVSGNEKWSFATEAAINSSLPVVVNDLVYIGAGDRTLHAIRC